MNEILRSITFILCLAILPFAATGFIRKVKALMQNRVGPPIFQPLLNFLKLWNKGETISDEASSLFRAAQIVNFSSVLVVALLVPWLSFQPPVPGSDLILVIYTLALARFFAMLAALDTGSSFGAFGASREAVLSLLVEPVIILSLVALAFTAQTTNLSVIFSFAGGHSLSQAPLWCLAAGGLFVFSLVELSRMPIDDPTTHLELTMVHEALILENSGRNLALAELSASLKLVVLYGLCGQSLLHAAVCIVAMPAWLLALSSVAVIFLLAFVTAAIESLAVKMQWSKAPEFIAYGLTMSMLACLAAIVMGGAL